MRLETLHVLLETRMHRKSHLERPKDINPIEAFWHFAYPHYLSTETKQILLMTEDCE